MLAMVSCSGVVRWCSAEWSKVDALVESGGGGASCSHGVVVWCGAELCGVERSREAALVESVLHSSILSCLQAAQHRLQGCTDRPLCAPGPAHKRAFHWAHPQKPAREEMPPPAPPPSGLGEGF